jgi:hypothetical protein
MVKTLIPKIAEIFRIFNLQDEEVQRTSFSPEASFYEVRIDRPGDKLIGLSFPEGFIALVGSLPFAVSAVSALVLGTALEDIIAKLVTDDVVGYEAKPVGLN